jgi:hypothetical protein
MATAKSAARKRAAVKSAPVRPAKAGPEAVAAPAPMAEGAKSLIRAGLKALGDVRGDMVARQTRVFELLLGIGQSPAWKAAAAERARALADPFGKFEDVFDQRVARSLERLGMPAPEALQALTEQVRVLAELLAEERATKARRR